VLALAAAAVRLYPGRPQSATTLQVAATERAADPSADATARLDAGLADALRGTAGHLSVAVLDTATGATASYGDDVFVTASIVKVDILAALLRQSDGALTAAQRTAAALMIENSDNDAATELFEAVGGAGGLDEANAAFGLRATTAGTEGYWGLTATTATDQLRLLQVVFGTDDTLGKASRSYLQGLMGSIADDQDWGVSAADDGGDPRLKNGWLPRTESGAWVINSIGRVVHDGRPVLVAVLSDGSATEQDGIDLVESVASAAVDSLTTAASTQR
jgi:hypothetical protein